MNSNYQENLFLEFYLGLAKKFEDHWWDKGARPLLAHYTSMNVAAEILKNEEIWFSNPLFMNDLQELRYGLITGHQRFVNSTQVQAACGTHSRFEIARREFENYFKRFEEHFALDIYVACFSEHSPTDDDGKLSMWRAYGGAR